MLGDCEQILFLFIFGHFYQCQNQFLLNLVENNFWEYNCKPFKESSLKAFTNIVNANFTNDVKWIWKKIWNKLKIFEKKWKKKVTSAPPSNWPWFEHFDNISFGTTKINGVLNVINQGVCVMHLKINEC